MVHGIKFDNSPTGLVQGKFEKEVDFNFVGGDTKVAVSNMKYIDSLCNGRWFS